MRGILLISLILVIFVNALGAVRIVVMNMDVYALPSKDGEGNIGPEDIRYASEMFSEFMRSRLQALGVDIVWNHEIETMCGTSLEDIGFNDLLVCCRENSVDKIITSFLAFIEEDTLITLKIFDVKTNRVEFVLFSEFEYDEDFMKKVRNFILEPNEGRIIKVDEDTGSVYMTFSKYSGVKKGDKLSVYRQELVDPDTVVVYEKRNRIGTVEVVSVGERGSLGKILEGEDEINEMDLVVIEN